MPFAPIIRYRERKREAHVDLIYYANAISIDPSTNSEDVNDPLRRRVTRTDGYEQEALCRTGRRMP